ncbi:MAG: hypothetical protein O3A14_18660 [Cyanobacteria bacterium]|nr:hypothetical protein [Cyanobacteriota bacterium]
MQLIYRGGLNLKVQRTRPQPDQEQPLAQPVYQGLRYSRYGVRYTR